MRSAHRRPSFCFELDTGAGELEPERARELESWGGPCVDSQFAPST